MSARLVRPLVSLCVLSLMTGLAACSSLEPVDPVINRYAGVNITAKSLSATQARANATVIFFEAISLAVPSSSQSQTDQCTFAPVDTTVQITQGEQQVGATVGFTSGATTYQLPYASGFRRYANTSEQVITYSGGDQASINISGEGGFFPATTFGIKLAEPLVVQPVAIPSAGAPLAVRWNGTNDATAAVILQIRYANPVTSPYANEQIFCSLRDDGAHDIPATGLAFFLASPSQRRSLTLIRWRTNETQPTSSTLLHITSSVDTTLVWP